MNKLIAKIVFTGRHRIYSFLSIEELIDFDKFSIIFTVHTVTELLNTYTRRSVQWLIKFYEFMLNTINLPEIYFPQINN